MFYNNHIYYTLHLETTIYHILRIYLCLELYIFEATRLTIHCTQQKLQSVRVKFISRSMERYANIIIAKRYVPKCMHESAHHSEQNFSFFDFFFPSEFRFGATFHVSQTRSIFLVVLFLVWNILILFHIFFYCFTLCCEFRLEGFIRALERCQFVLAI